MTWHYEKEGPSPSTAQINSEMFSKCQVSSAWKTVECHVIFMCYMASTTIRFMRKGHPMSASCFRLSMKEGEGETHGLLEKRCQQAGEVHSQLPWLHTQSFRCFQGRVGNRESSRWAASFLGRWASSLLGRSRIFCCRHLSR